MSPQNHLILISPTWAPSHRHLVKFVGGGGARIIHNQVARKGLRSRTSLSHATLTRLEM